MTGAWTRALAAFRATRPVVPFPTAPVGAAAIEADHAKLRQSALEMAIMMAGSDWPDFAPQMAQFLIEGTPDGEA